MHSLYSLLWRGLGSVTAIALIAGSAPAKVPQVIAYQGRLVESGGGVVPDGPQLIQFVIYDAPSGGASLWSSGFTSVTIADGLFTVLLGAPPQPVLPDDLFGGDLFAPDTARWLGITVGADPELNPRTKFTSAAYAYQALRADTAEQAFDVIGQVIGTDNLADGAVTVQKLAPGIATAAGELNTFANLGSETTGSPQTMQSVIITAPSAGRLVVIATGQCYANLDAAGTTSEIGCVFLGLCDQPATSSSGACDNTWTSMWFQDADNVSFSSTTGFFTLTRVFDIPAGGSYQYYLNGATCSTSYEMFMWDQVRFTAVFAPVALPMAFPLLPDKATVTDGRATPQDPDQQ